MPQNDRKNYIDAVKGISMMAIIAGHFSNDLIERFVFTFHVPIFFIVSGLFYSQRDGIVGKRFKQLIKPYCVTGVIIWLLSFIKAFLKICLRGSPASDLLFVTKRSIIEILYGSGSRTDFFSLKMESIGAVWFLLAVIWATFFVYYIEKLISEKYLWLKWLSVLIIFLLAMVSAYYVWLPFSIQAGMSSALFLYTGYRLKQRNMLDKLNNVWFLILLTGLWIVELIFSYINDNMSIVRSYFPDVWINVLGSVSISIVVVIITQKVECNKAIADSKCYHFLCWFGKNSLIVLCFHLIELRLFPWRIMSTVIHDHHVYIVVVFIMKIFMTSFLTWIVMRSKNIKRIFI